MEKYTDLSKEELITIILALTEKIAELEAQLKQNSGNSGRPPSSDGLAKPAVKSLREKSGKKPGGQKGHKGHGLRIDREPDEVVIVTPIACSCGCNLAGETTRQADTRYVYDVKIEVRLTEYDIHETICPNCGMVVVATPPAQCRGTKGYGNALRALCVVLTQYANVSIQKTHKILRDLLGIPISDGTIKSIQSEFADKTAPSIAEIKGKLLKSPTLHVDETGMRVAGRTQWVHVASNSKYTLVSVHKKRGKEGSDSGGVLPQYTGTMIHDFWKPYFGFDSCGHALCCAHLLRELNALIECGVVWASAMKSLLLDMKEVIERYKYSDKTELSRYYREKFVSRYNAVLADALLEVRPSLTRKKSKEENLLIRFQKYRSEITRFTADFNIPFDNNQAERDVRGVKVKQKVSGCLRTVNGAEEFAKTSSVISTAVKLGQSVVGVVSDLFAGIMPPFEGATE